MSLELIYTSAAKGLRPSSSGFCTVAATGGMSKAVATKLEGLSAYDFHYKLSDPNAASNPANFSHTVVQLGGSMHSVLSRVGFCGPDFSGRANKIAHHVLLSDEDRLQIGPAEMMLQMREQIFCEQYSDPPRDLPPRPLSQQLSDTPKASAMARTWRQLSGDAGWAGPLAKAFVDNGRTPAYVIYEPGVDVLRLMAESLSLLPPAQRWQVNFATYYTSLPAGCFYHWRAVLAGSRAVAESRRFPNAAVIDLTRPLPAAPDDDYSAAARKGRQVAVAAPVSQDREAAAPIKVAPLVAPRGQRAPRRSDKATRSAVAELAERKVQLPAGRAINASPTSRKLAIVFGILAMLLLVSNAVTLVLWQNDAGTGGETASAEGDRPAGADISPDEGASAEVDTQPDEGTSVEADTKPAEGTQPDEGTSVEADTKPAEGASAEGGPRPEEGIPGGDDIVSAPSGLVSRAEVVDCEKTVPRCEQQDGTNPADLQFSYKVPGAVRFVESPSDVDVKLEITDDSGDAASAELLARKTPDDDWKRVATCTLAGDTLTVLYHVDYLAEKERKTIVIEVASRAKEKVYQCRELPLKKRIDLAWGYDDNGVVIKPNANKYSTALGAYIREDTEEVPGRTPSHLPKLWRQLELAGDKLAKPKVKLATWLGKRDSSPFPLVRLDKLDLDKLDVSLRFTGPETGTGRREIEIVVGHGCLADLKQKAKVPALLAAIDDIKGKVDAASKDLQEKEERCKGNNVSDEEGKARDAASKKHAELEKLLEDLQKKVGPEGDEYYKAATDALLKRIGGLKAAINNKHVDIKDPWGMPVVRVNLRFLPKKKVDKELIRLIGLARIFHEY